MWGQRSSASHCVVPPTSPLHPLTPAQAGPFVTLGFYSVYFVSNGNICRETWYPKGPPVLVFTKKKKGGRTPNGGPWSLGLPLTLHEPLGLFAAFISSLTLGSQGREPCLHITTHPEPGIRL